MMDKSFPRISASITLIMLAQVAALVARSYLDIQLRGKGFDEEVARNLSYLVVPFIEIVLLWPLLRANKAALLSLFGMPKSWLRLLLTGMALGVAARFTGWGVIIAATAFGWFDYAPEGLGTNLYLFYQCPSPGALLLGMVVGSVLIPIGEEIINRGLVMGQLLAGNKNRAIFGSAILFTILHEPQGMLAAFVLGIAFSILALRCCSLLPGLVAHATYNLLRIFDWVCPTITWHPEALAPETVVTGSMAAIMSGCGLVTVVWIVMRANTGTN